MEADEEFQNLELLVYSDNDKTLANLLDYNVSQYVRCSNFTLDTSLDVKYSKLRIFFTFCNIS